MLLLVLASLAAIDMVSCAQDVRKGRFSAPDSVAHAFWKVATSL